MKFSLASIHSKSDFYQTHLWSLKFLDSTPNIQSSGGGIGHVIPAQSVSEPLFEIDYEAVPLANGLSLTLPKVVNYLGTLDFEFYDSGNSDDLLKIEQFFLEWSMLIHSDNTFLDMMWMTKIVMVEKYSRTSDSSVLKSIYQVFPPKNLQFKGNTSVSVYTNSVSLDIVHVILKNNL